MDGPITVNNELERMRKESAGAIVHVITRSLTEATEEI